MSVAQQRGIISERELAAERRVAVLGVYHRYSICQLKNIQVAYAELPPQRYPAESGGRQEVSLTSSPSGAKVVADGNFTASCSTPCVLRVMPGRHTITFSQAGYINEYREIKVGNAAVELPQVTLRQPQGAVFLTTDPRGASIRVNGDIVPQVTPATLTLAPGEYYITVERNGASKTARVQVGDSIVRLNISLGQ
jgi:hypothetical protein